MDNDDVVCWTVWTACIILPIMGTIGGWPQAIAILVVPTAVAAKLVYDGFKHRMARKAWQKRRAEKIRAEHGAALAKYGIS